MLWGAVNLLTNIVDLSMTSALQRVVPTRETEAHAHGAVKLALLVTVLPAAARRLAGRRSTPSAVAALFSAAPGRCGAPAAARSPCSSGRLPLWTFVEVATSAARARRAFGPEIRLRIFWEQIARIVFAVGFFAARRRTASG